LTTDTGKKVAVKIFKPLPHTNEGPSVSEADHEE